MKLYSPFLAVGEKHRIIMDATERCHEIPEFIGLFVGLEIEDTLRITVADVTIECRVHDIDRRDRRFTLLLETFAGDYLRVETLWVGGWLDPQVDRLKPIAEERQPLGQLQEIEIL